MTSSTDDWDADFFGVILPPASVILPPASAHATGLPTTTRSTCAPTRPCATQSRQLLFQLAPPLCMAF
eukprot:317048-Pleurochrysis_carterae.AAC.1